LGEVGGVIVKEEVLLFCAVQIVRKGLDSVYRKEETTLNSTFDKVIQQIQSKRRDLLADLKTTKAQKIKALSVQMESLINFRQKLAQVYICDSYVCPSDRYGD